MTWSTDAALVLADALARTALAAVSEASVEAGGDPVTDLAAYRTQAHDDIVTHFAQQGTDEGGLTNTSGLARCETFLALAILFESLAQWSSDNRPDVYAQKATYWRGRYDDAIASTAPSIGQKAKGASFEWGRG